MSGKHSQHLLHRSRMCYTAVDRLGVPGYVRDHVPVMYRVHRREVAGIERVVAFLH
jgi:hypothetical protein